MNYLDTSAFVKYYRKEEEGSDKIIWLINEARNGKEQLMSSFFIVGETISVFDKWKRHKYISDEECAELIKIFLKDIKDLIDSEISG